MKIYIAKEGRQEQEKFKKLFPNIFERYQLYVGYYRINTGKDFEKDKGYDTILIKSLVAYFLYQERIYNKKLTKQHISILMNYKDHTGILYAIRRIKHLLMVQPKYKVFDKTISDFFLIYNGIFTQSFVKEKSVKEKFKEKSKII